MRITKDNATFSQNKFNFYVGNIDTTETILIDSSFIIVGDIKTSKNILAEHDLIVMGDIEAKSIYICKDLLCTGKINTEISEIEGEFKVLEKNIFEKDMKLEIIQTKKDNTGESEQNKLNKDDDIKSVEKEKQKNEIETKYKRITREKDLNEGDLVVHNSLGEGKFISISKDKIKIDFKTRGVRAISKDVTFKLGLLKKKTQNEVYYTKRDNLSKEEYIKKIDNLINTSNKSNSLLKKDNENILSNKKSLTTNARTYIYEESLNNKNINNSYKNKSINFYVKDINSYIIDDLDNLEKMSEIHYIKYNNFIYVRLNQICDFLSVNSHTFDNCISNSIKISYYGKGINGIKFIDIDNILDNKNFILEKLRYYDNKSLQKYSTILEILEHIKFDCSINLHNAVPYLRYVIDGILDNKNISIEELAKEWNVSVENIEFVRLGFTSPLSKFKQLIKDNKVENPNENHYKIREVKLSDINIEQSKEYKYKEDSDVYDELVTEVDKIDIITNKIYELLQQYNYDIQDINIKNIEVNNNGKYLVDLEIKDMKSVSSTVSLMEYLSCKISELTKEEVKLNLSEFDKGKFISEIMEVSLNSLKEDIYNNKYYIIIDIDDFDIKNTLLEENKDYINGLTGYSVELTFDDKVNKEIEMFTNKTTSKKALNINKIKSDRVDLTTKTKIINSNNELEHIGKDDITKLLLTQNVAFKNIDINEFECGKIKKSYHGYTFDYVKYNGKIYIRAGQISNILNIDINRLYPYLEESIKIRYVDSFVSNAKFSSSKSILKAINKVQQMYPHEKLSENRVELITKCIDDVLKNSKKLNNNTPYWRLVLEYMMFDLKISREELKIKWGISSYDIELMTLGFSPSKVKTRTLIKEEIKI